MSTAVAKIETTKYEVLQPGSTAAELVAANTAGEEIGIGDLDRIRVPAGGATTWSVPSIEGEKSEKVLEGIIVHVARRRAFWSDPNPTGDPPDCKSSDCVEGIGEPGGLCATCPFNEFGSARKQDGSAGRGKGCKETRLLFLLREGNHLPEAVIVPPGSLKAVKGYLLKLKVPYWGAVTRLKLAKTKNKDSIDFAQIAPEFVGALDGEQVAQVKRYADSLKDVFEAVSVEQEEIEGDE